MNRIKLDPDSVKVEGFDAAPREEVVARVNTLPCPTRIQTCTNCLDDTCIC